MILTDAVVESGFPLWNMRRMGRPSNIDTPMKRARVTAGMTQEEVAGEMGVAPTTVQRWEAGLREVSGTVLAKLADLYDASADELLGRSAPAARPTIPQIPNAEQLEEAIRGFADAFYPEIGPLDEEATRSCALAWYGYLKGFAERPTKFAAPGQTAFAVELIAGQYARQQRQAS